MIVVYIFVCLQKRFEKLRKAGYILYWSWMLINFEICGQTSYHEAVAQGLRFQVQADSMQRRIEAQTLALATASDAQKNGIRIAIRDHELQAVALQKKANEWFAQAMASEEAHTPIEANDTVSLTEEVDDVAIAEAAFRKNETGNFQEPEFVILYSSPYSSTRPIPIDQTLPDGVIYKIQLGAFSKPVSFNTFKGLTPLSGETSANGITKYYAGMFRQFAAATDALRKVHDYGFKDAFIVAFYNRKTINTERARQLEAGR